MLTPRWELQCVWQQSLQPSLPLRIKGVKYIFIYLSECVYMWGAGSKLQFFTNNLYGCLFVSETLLLLMSQMGLVQTRETRWPAQGKRPAGSEPSWVRQASSPYIQSIHSTGTSPGKGGYPSPLLSLLKYNYIQHVTRDKSGAPPWDSGLLMVIKCSTCEEFFKYSALCMHDSLSTVIRITGTQNFGMEWTLEAISFHILILQMRKQGSREILLFFPRSLGKKPIPLFLVLYHFREQGKGSSNLAGS